MKESFKVYRFDEDLLGEERRSRAKPAHIY
jgi:hypothetical protein